MSGDIEIYLEQIIENQTTYINTQHEIQVIQIVIAMAVVTILIYLFVSRCMK